MNAERANISSRALWYVVDWTVGTFAVLSLSFILWFDSRPGPEKCAEFADTLTFLIAYGGGWAVGAIVLCAVGVSEIAGRRLSLSGLLLAVGICLALVIAPPLVMLVASFAHVYFGLIANAVIVAAIAVALLAMVWKRRRSLLSDMDLHLSFLVLVVFGATAAAGLLLQLGCLR